jgi:hypothetical protein
LGRNATQKGKAINLNYSTCHVIKQTTLLLPTLTQARDTLQALQTFPDAGKGA